MIKFAHISDCHLGAYRDLTLRELNLSAFENAMDTCMKEKVDFILIAGDLFDNNLPDTKILNQAVKKMKQVRESGIEIYVIYGSHDYSPTKTSMIDILQSAGLFTRVGGDAENPHLEFVIDSKTGVKIAGMSARRLGIEAKQLGLLDFSDAEKETGFKIFVFHSSVAECHEEFASIPGSISVSQLPGNFTYYASGHIHSRFMGEKNGRLIGFPGPTFGSDYRDLETTAKGEKKGFLIIEAESSKIERARFVPVESPEVVFLEYDATGKSSSAADKEIDSLASSADAKGKIILFRISGELSSGKPGDMDFARAKDMLMQEGALVVYINRNSLTAKEQDEIKAAGETREEIEANLFASASKEFKTENESLMNNSALLAIDLLKMLKEEQKGGTKNDYEKKMVENSMKMLGLS